MASGSPWRTSAPTGASALRPTAWSIGPRGGCGRRRAPPRRGRFARGDRGDIAGARRRHRTHDRRLRQIASRCARRNRRGRRARRPCGRRSRPPCRCRAPRWRAAALPGWSRRSPADCSISAASASVTSSSRLSRARPVRKSTAFCTSTALPAAEASGSFMSVISAVVFRPAPLATSTRLVASSRGVARLAP